MQHASVFSVSNSARFASACALFLFLCNSQPALADDAVDGSGAPEAAPVDQSDAVETGDGSGTVDEGSAAAFGAYMAGPEDGPGLSRGFATGATAPARQGPEAVVRQGELRITGTADEESVWRIARENRRSIRDCYETELLQSPDLESPIDLLLEVVVAGDGTILSATITEATLTLPALEACIAAQVTRWPVPASSDGTGYRVVFSYTLATSS